MFDVNFVLSGDQKLENLIGLAEGGDTLAEGVGDPGLVTGVGVNDVPVDGIGIWDVGVDDHVAGDVFAP